MTLLDHARAHERGAAARQKDKKPNGLTQSNMVWHIESKRGGAAYSVSVPPGPLNIMFVYGTCRVHEVFKASPLLGATKKGETLMSVNGKPVTPTTMYDVINAADDGTSERMLVFGRKAADDGTSERKLVFR